MSMASVISPQPSTPVMAASPAASISTPPPPQQQPGPRVSMTSKEWVIPPRPKPGRKPATDTPPTKRKAQNRAAQRAFRERRAARVGELEEQIEHNREAHVKEESELKERIRSLELQLEAYKSKCATLENLLGLERQGRLSVKNHAQGAGGGGGEEDTATSPTVRDQRGSVAGEGRPSTARSVDDVLPSLESSGDMDTGTGLGCGDCVPEGPCACAETALASVICNKCGDGSACECFPNVLQPQPQPEQTQMQTQTQPPSQSQLQSQHSKRPNSPQASSSEEKRRRQGLGEMEMDFTSMYARKPTGAAATGNLFTPDSTQQLQLGSATGPARDGCGFCSDGDYCICNDATLSTDLVSVAPATGRAAPQTQTPPPSETDLDIMPMEITATGAVKLPSLRSSSRKRMSTPQSTSSTCGPRGPGSCAQCLADPKSGLFCRSLAANFGKTQDDSGCCGARGPTGGCCKGSKGSSRPQGRKLGLSLSCADAYKTLSSHRNFDEAADDIGSWLPRLKAAPRPEDEATSRRGHLPIEVEAASIMTVLKDFDVRFGR